MSVYLRRWMIGMALTLWVATIVLVGCRDLRSGESGGAEGGTDQPAWYFWQFSQDKVAKAPAVLADGHEATVDFFIGTPLDPRGAGKAHRASSQAFLDKVDKHPETEILLRMTCWVCQDRPIQTAVLQYQASSHTSQTVHMAFTPLASMAAKTDKRMSFEVTIAGAYVNTVSADFAVEGAGVVSPATGVSHREVPRPAAEAVANQFQVADLELSAWSERSQVKLSFYAATAELRQELIKLGVPNVTRAANFTTDATQEGLFELAKRFHCQSTLWLRDSDDLPLRQAHCKSPSDALTSTGERFNSQDSDNLLKFIGSNGWTFYTVLFRPTDHDGVAMKYMRALDQLQATTGRRPVINVTVSDVYVPWPMLIGSPDSVEWLKFDKYWGTRFVVSERPVQAHPNLVRSIEGIRNESETAFVVYHDGPKAAAHSIGDRGTQLAGSVLQSSHIAQKPLMARSADGMYDLFKTRHTGLKLIVAYTHGVASSVDDPQKLLLHQDDDYVDAPDFFAKTAAMQGFETLFASKPFVLLNGCETGAVGASPQSEVSFVGAFLERGAAGVVATQAKVLQGSMYFYADNLLRMVLAGEPVSSAVTKTRLLLYYGSAPEDPTRWPRDPTGLLYSYHGLPDLAFRKSPNS